MLLQLDFEKAFDSIEWSYLAKVLSKFNFGETFRRLFKICYTNISSTVMNNGHTCGWFSVERGVRHGCPLSSILFILCIEILAQQIRNNKNVSGYSYKDKNYKMSLFADDATCIFSNILQFDIIFQIIGRFSQYSGLKLNFQKSQLVYILPWRIKPNIQYELSIIETGSFNMLGVELGGNRPECESVNLGKKINKIGVKFNIFKQRGLTIFGKVLIAKSQGISNLVYTLSCVDCPEKYEKQAQLTVNNFIWPKGNNKIKHKTMIGDYDKL